LNQRDQRLDRWLAPKVTTVVRPHEPHELRTTVDQSNHWPAAHTARVRERGAAAVTNIQKRATPSEVKTAPGLRLLCGARTSQQIGPDWEPIDRNISVQPP